MIKFFNLKLRGNILLQFLNASFSFILNRIITEKDVKSAISKLNLLSKFERFIAITLNFVHQLFLDI